MVDKKNGKYADTCSIKKRFNTICKCNWAFSVLNGYITIDLLDKAWTCMTCHLNGFLLAYQYNQTCLLNFINNEIYY